MSDVPSETPPPADSPPSRSTQEPLTPAGRAALRGEAPTEATVPDLKWTARDGTAVHGLYEDVAQDELEDLDRGIVVTSNEPVLVTKPDGSLQQGCIDTLIEHGEKATVIDYKTHDMKSWADVDAKHFGHLHGGQVKEYVHSLGRPPDTQGYIVAVGRPPDDANARATYVETLRQYQVSAKFPADGEPKAVARSLGEIAKERGIR